MLLDLLREISQSSQNFLLDVQAEQGCMLDSDSKGVDAACIPDHAERVREPENVFIWRPLCHYRDMQLRLSIDRNGQSTLANEL